MTLWIVLGIVVVAVVLAVAALELALRTAMPPRIDAVLTDAFGGPTTVALPAPPLLPHVLRRRLPEVTVHATDVPVGDGDGRIDRLVIHLHDVAFSRSANGGQPLDVAATDARFEAVLAASSLARLGDLPPIVRSLEVEPDTLWVTTVAGVRVATTVDVADDGALVVRPRSGALASLPFSKLRFELPELPAGATVRAVALTDGEVVASGPVDGSRLLDV